MNKLILFILMAFTASLAFSQQLAHQRGNFNISLGASFFPANLEENEEIDITPLHILADYSILDFLSFGVHFGYGTTRRDFDYVPTQNPDTTLKLRETQGGTLLGARVDFHFPLQSRYTDLYAGGMMGAAFESSAFRNQADNTVIENEELMSNETTFAWEVHAGARLRLSDNFGAYVEGGYGRAFLKAGLNFKL